jgi:MFS transporter, OPA family, glycerol-3-phosphate transporter
VTDVSACLIDDSRLRRWQAITLGVLLIGYTGYYICRSNLSVATPLLLREFAGSGFDRRTIGAISSMGILFYAAGKLITGLAGDFAGGRAMFLVGLFGSVAATIVFGAGSSVPVFAAAWAFNRFVQSAGWGGLVKVASHWFSAKRYGTVMAVLSLSFLFGDAIGRYILGAFLANGATWRGLFWMAASLLAAIGVGAFVLLRSSPRDVGCPEPDVNAGNLYGEAGTVSRPDNLADLLRPYASAVPFWLVCAVSCGLTLIREAFNAWIPVYLVDVHRLSVSQAAQYSSMFPFIGGLSTLAAGIASDHVSRGARIAIAVPCLVLCSGSLVLLAAASASHSLSLSLTAIGLVAFWLLGPYSLLAGAVALDFGGRRGSATAAGLIDSAGYLGAVLSGYAVGAMVETSGWTTAFRALALIAAASLFAAIAYWYRARRGGMNGRSGAHYDVVPGTRGGAVLR